MADIFLKTNKNLRLYLLFTLLSQTGGFIQNVALSAYITSRFDNNNALGWFLFVSYLPVFLLSVPASKLSRKISLKSILAITEILLFIMTVFLCFFSSLPYTALLVYGSVWGIIRAFQTPASASVVKEITSKSELGGAVKLQNLSVSVARAAGPILSGLIYSFFGFLAAFVVNACAFIPAFFLIFKTEIPKPESFKKEKPSLSVYIMVIVFVTALFGTCYNIIFTGICKKLMLSKMWFSIFMGGVGLGALFGAFIYNKAKKSTLYAVGISASLLLCAVLENSILLFAVSVVFGLCDFLFFTAVLQKINQKNTPGSLPFAMGIYSAVTTGALPLGYLVMNYLKSGFGINTALIFAAVIIALISLLFLGKTD